MKRKSLSLFIIITIIISIFSGSFADNLTTEKVSKDKTSVETSINIVDETLTIFDEDDNVLSRASDLKSSEVMSQTMDAQISVNKKGFVSLEGSLTDSGKLYEFTGNGPIYTNIGGFKTFGDFLITDLESKGVMNIVKLRFNPDKKGKGKTGEYGVTLLIENTESGKIFLLEKNIKIANYKKLIKAANKNSLDYSAQNGVEEFQDHFVSLMSSQENMKSRSFEKKSNSFDDDEVEKIENSTIRNESEELEKSYTYSEIDRLLRDVKNYGSVKLSNYNVPSSLFTTSGWEFTHGYSNPRYSVSSYTMEENFAGENIVFISMIDYIKQWYSASNYVYETQLKMKHSVSLTYCHEEDLLELGYVNQGVDITNAKMVIGNLTGRNIFDSRYVSGTLTGSPETLKGLIALCPPAVNNLPTVWDYLSKDIDQRLDSEETYDNTYDKQLERNNNRVIKSVSVETGSYSLEYQGNLVLLRGKMTLEESGTFQTSYGYGVGIFN